MLETAQYVESDGRAGMVGAVVGGWGGTASTVGDPSLEKRDGIFFVGLSGGL